MSIIDDLSLIYDVVVEFRARQYFHNGSYWVDCAHFTKAPTSLQHTLDEHARSRIEAADRQLVGQDELLEAAKSARDGGNSHRGVGLARRALKIESRSVGAGAVLSSCLRADGRPEQALRETEHLAFSSYGPLQTSRAAAFCDLEKYEVAKKVIAPVLARSRDCPEALAVVGRIKRARPELYPPQKGCRRSPSRARRRPLPSEPTMRPSRIDHRPRFGAARNDN